MRRNLVDEYMLLIHLLVPGAGRRLFTDGGACAARTRSRSNHDGPTDVL